MIQGKVVISICVALIVGAIIGTYIGVRTQSRYFSPSSLYMDEFNKIKCVEEVVAADTIKKCYKIIEVPKEQGK